MTHTTLEPTFTFLEQLVSQSSLVQKDSLCKAVRLWSIIDTVYHNPLNLSFPLNFKDWFEQVIQTEAILRGVVNDLKGVPLSIWLFEIGKTPKAPWVEAFRQKSNLSLAEIETHLNQVCPYASPSGKEVSEVSYRRWLRNDFSELVSLQFIRERNVNGKSSTHKGKKEFYPLLQLPRRLNAISSFGERNQASGGQLAKALASPELSHIIGRYLAPINGVRRFYMDLDYVVSEVGGDLVDQVQNFLYDEVWMKDITPLVQLSYNSLSCRRNVDIVTYPVAIYYSKRAPYLCAYGQMPHGKADEIDFYNFRLDQIYKAQVLSWSSSPKEMNIPIPQQLLDEFSGHELPTSEHVQQEMEAAWGFDICRPAVPMVLRFERKFHEVYIHESDRHLTFTRLNKEKDLVEFLEDYDVPGTEQERILKHIQANPDDAFYSAVFREGDNNIVMRLRAWGPKLEVLYPLSLRQQMQDDLRRALAMYGAVT